MAEKLKSEMRRVSSQFATTIDRAGKIRNRTFVGQCDHVLAVYNAVVLHFRHDEIETISKELEKVKGGRG